LIRPSKPATKFKGKELRAEIFENHRTRPTDGDEFVQVLSGKLILTEPNGTVHECHPGDALVLPAGYTGTWDMQGNYRGLAVVMQKGK
jgi:uncharacterized cupin superfamily protein